MKDETPEQIIEEAKRYEKIAHGAEYLRTKMRLGEKVYEQKTTVTKRLIFHDRMVVGETLLTYGEDTALYQALGIVRDDATMTARKLRDQVQVVKP